MVVDSSVERLHHRVRLSQHQWRLLAAARLVTDEGTLRLITDRIISGDDAIAAVRPSVYPFVIKCGRFCFFCAPSDGCW